MSKTKLKQPAVKRKPAPVDHIKVDPEVWQQALLAAQMQKLPKSVIQIIGPDDVIVWNHSGPWPIHR